MPNWKETMLSEVYQANLIHYLLIKVFFHVEDAAVSYLFGEIVCFN